MAPDWRREISVCPRPQLPLRLPRREQQRRDRQPQLLLRTPHMHTYHH
ncbi:hypothetical protein [Streptomyces calidiresistens]